jgi:cytochrome c-type protein NapB
VKSVRLALGLVVLATGCAADDSHREIRASRRAYDGAPPVIPHVPFGASCSECHGERALAVPDVGWAPASPHAETAGMAFPRCQQCHVFQRAEHDFKRNLFVGRKQTAKPAPRAHPLAPPVVPHPVFMRENCLACHDGPGAREEIRTTHPERTRCQQCHVEQRTTRSFEPSPAG